MFKQAVPLLVPLVASDTLLLLSAVAGGLGHQLAASVLGAAFGAALLTTVLQKRYVDRLAPWKASAGSTASVHVTVLTESGAVIDSTKGKRPLAINVGQQVALPSSDISTASLGSSAALSSESTSQPTNGVLLSKEGAKDVRRFDIPLFSRLLSESTLGLVVGERLMIKVHNPAPNDGGFLNPGMQG